jgi:hypothetical protein
VQSAHNYKDIFMFLALHATGFVEFQEKFGAQVHNFAFGKKEAYRAPGTLRGSDLQALKRFFGS